MNVLFVELYETNNVTISRSTIGNYSYYGAYIYYGNNVTISSSTISGSLYGVFIDKSNNVTISSNAIFNNTYSGLQIWYTGNTTIFNNTIYNNYDGVHIFNSKNLTITKNTIDSNHGGSGIFMYFDSNVTILDNLIHNNDQYGVLIELSDHIDLAFNNFVVNDRALYICESSNISVYLNNFIDSIYPLVDEDSNSFDNGQYGNYWSSYTGTDGNGDLIADSEFQIDSDSIDHYPLMAPVHCYKGSVYYLIANSTTPRDSTLVKIKIVYNTTNVEPIYILYRSDETELYAETSYNQTSDIYYSEIFLTQVEITDLIMGQVITDNPPTISDVTWSPQNPLSNQSVTVYAEVADDWGITTVILSYYNGTWYNISMSVSGGKYTEIIPPQAANTTVTFKIYAMDMVGHWTVSDNYQVTFSSPQAPNQEPGPEPGQEGTGGILGGLDLTTIAIIVLVIVSIIGVVVIIVKRRG